MNKNSPQQNLTQLKEWMRFMKINPNKKPKQKPNLNFNFDYKES